MEAILDVIRSGYRPSRAASLVLVVILLPAMATAGTGPVVAVVTDGIVAYAFAVEGFKQEYGGDLVIHRLPKGAEVDDDLEKAIRKVEPRALLAVGSKAAISLKSRFDEIPIVYAMVLDPEKRGLSGDNVTGVTLEIPAAEQFRQFKRVVPTLQTIGVVYNPEKSERLIRTAREAARQAGLTLLEEMITETGEVPDAFTRLASKVDGIWLVPDASVVTRRTLAHLLKLSLQRKLPVLVFSVAFVKAGALVGVAPDYPAIGRESARMVKKILGGASPGTLPSRAPPSVVVINRTTAASLGVELTVKLRAGTQLVE